MELDSQTRVDYLTYSKKGISSLMKQQKKYLIREEEIVKLYRQYDNAEINNYQLLESTSKLFISNTFCSTILSITERFENIENEDQEEDILNETIQTLFEPI